MVVAEGPSRGDFLAGQMYIGQVGKEFTKMLHEVGILQTEVLLTSVCRENIKGWDSKKYFSKYTKTNQHPIHEVNVGMELLQKEIAEVKPNLIIALGELSLWALTGNVGITKWRGSILEANGVKIVPVYAPEVVARKYDWRFIAIQDLRRCEQQSHFPEVRIPEYNFIIRPEFSVVMDTLEMLQKRADVEARPRGDAFSSEDTSVPDSENGAQTGSNQSDRLVLSGDIETRLGHITCFGIGWSQLDAICIPFTCVENNEGYWNEAEEIAIVQKLMELFKNPKIGWVFQNGIYDLQYFAKHWGFVPFMYMDTMLAHHTCWAGLPKGLDFQSSIYCEFHRYWKDEGKEFHKSIKSPSDEELYWVYNCKDCVTTQEIAVVLSKVITDLKQEEPYAFQMRQFPVVLRMMLRGIRIDRKRKGELAMELFDALAEREQWMEAVIGRVLNPRSPKQMTEFFYNELGLPIQKNRKTKKPTTDANALATLAKKEPLVAPLIQCISEFRSIGVFLSTFVKAPLDTDGRMRSSYNIAGTETYRWSSSTDAFGTGMNLQNVPKGNEE